MLNICVTWSQIGSIQDGATPFELSNQEKEKKMAFPRSPWVEKLLNEQDEKKKAMDLSLKLIVTFRTFH